MIEQQTDPRWFVERTVPAGGRIDEVFEAMTSMPLPDALETEIARGTRGLIGEDEAHVEPSAFERFAARQLESAGASDIRGIAQHAKLTLMRRSLMPWFRVVVNAGELAEDERQTVLAVEAALNRIAFVAEAAGMQSDRPGLVSSFNDEQIDALVAHMMKNWNEHAGFVDYMVKAPNPYRSVYGVHAPENGAWDILTQFKNTCDGLQLPFRLDTSAEAYPQTGDMAISFNVPEPVLFSAVSLNAVRSGDNVDGGEWVNCESRRDVWASTYALRLAGLLTYVGFGASDAITDITVIGRRGNAHGSAVFSLKFDRVGFYFDVLPLYHNGRFNADEFDSNPQRLITLLQPVETRVSFNEQGGFIADPQARVPQALLDLRKPLREDVRELADNMKALLRADRVCELDVSNDLTYTVEDIQAIVRDNADSLVTAMLELESAQMQLTKEQPMMSMIRQPLYCDREALRLLVSQTEGGEATRYRKIGGALAAVYAELARIYYKLGRSNEAFLDLRKLQQMSPTSIQSYVEETMAYLTGDEPQFNRAIDAITLALSIAVVPEEVAFLYCTFGTVLTATGDKNAALSCYLMASTVGHTTEFSDVARESAEALLSGTEDLMPTRAQTIKALRDEGIPVAPTQDNMQCLTTAVMMLTDAGVPLAAFDGVGLLAAYSGEDTMLWLCNALRLGAGEEKE